MYKRRLGSHGSMGQYVGINLDQGTCVNMMLGLAIYSMGSPVFANGVGRGRVYCFDAVGDDAGTIVKSSAMHSVITSLKYGNCMSVGRACMHVPSIV